MHANIPLISNKIYSKLRERGTICCFNTHALLTSVCLCSERDREREREIIIKEPTPSDAPVMVKSHKGKLFDPIKTGLAVVFFGGCNFFLFVLYGQVYSKYAIALFLKASLLRGQFHNLSCVLC